MQDIPPSEKAAGSSKTSVCDYAGNVDLNKSY